VIEEGNIALKLAAVIDLFDTNLLLLSLNML
jgi:hypothetical protein